VRDNILSTTGSSIDSNSTGARSFSSFNAQTSYPLVRNFETVQAVIEPTVALTLAPNIDQDDEIPDEDSQDAQIDASNLFEVNRFPGLDRVEDGSHATYGLRTGLYGQDGSHGDVFFGQSYRFDASGNPFSSGSGLDEQQSDFVGQVSADYQDRYLLNYRFQLDNTDLSPQRHEVDAGVTFNRFSLSSRYLYAKALQGTDIVETREQIDNGASYYLTRDWRVDVSARHDLGEDPGLRSATAGLNYFGQCLSWNVTGQRTLTDDVSGDNDTTLLFRIGLKNLGEFQESGFTDSVSPD
jgi:LPS-assembly protein